MQKVTLEGYPYTSDTLVYIDESLKLSGIPHEILDSAFAFEWDREGEDLTYVYGGKDSHQRFQVHRNTGREQIFSYGGFMIMHMMTCDEEKTEAALCAVDILEDLMFKDVPIREKSIHQTVHNCFAEEQ